MTGALQQAQWGMGVWLWRPEEHLGGGGKAVIRRDVESSKGEFVFTLGVTQAYFQAEEKELMGRKKV